MAVVLSLLRAAHARGTHHFLALDALTRLNGPVARDWERLFYKHIALYVDGAKAPDKAFKDFENHVLHPRDGYWGGAVAQAETWYGELVGALRRQDWAAAAYAAGVLSHYVTDPMQPLHTHQTDAESNIHAGVEWTVSKTYDRLSGDAKLATTIPAFQAIMASKEPSWLRALLRAGAERATTHYETILAHYDFKRGVVAPEEGLDPVGQRAMAEMLHHATTAFALVLDRAVAEAAVTPPQVALAGDALHAFVNLPRSWWAKRRDAKAERKAIEAMYDELMTTGAVVKTLPEDERKIRALFAADVVAKRVAAPVGSTEAASPVAPVVAAPQRDVEAVAPPASTEDGSRPIDDEGVIDTVVEPKKRVAVEAARPAPKLVETPLARSRRDMAAAEESSDATPAAPAIEPVSAVAPAPVSPPTLTLIEAAAPIAALASMAPVQIPVPESAKPAASLSTYRPSQRGAMVSLLSLESDVVDAPSIGPKTAVKLNAVGIDTVGDFLKAHPIALAARLENSGMTPDILSDWQDQTRLMCMLPDLKASHVKLLVGAGYRTADAIATAEADQLCADILSYVLKPEGQRILRDGNAPDVEQIRTWATNARAIKAA